MNLLLKRDPPATLGCTLGILTLADHRWQTLERPWLPSPSGPGGLPQVSCVPPGTYRLLRHDSARHPRTWALQNPDLGVLADPEPGMRSEILIHPANFVRELKGCIAIGLGRQLMDDEWALTQSRAAFVQLQDALSWDDSHTLTIEGS